MPLAKLIVLISFLFFSMASICQPTFVYTDADKLYKEAKEFCMKGQYAKAYPLLKDIKNRSASTSLYSPLFITDELEYYNALCELKIDQPNGEKDALVFIHGSKNTALLQMMHFHLGHYYFLNNNFENTINQYKLAGNDNLNNDQLAQAKFEKAYAYFNRKEFVEAKNLFNEMIQLPGNEHYLSANYYYGFICYYQRNFEEALRAFKKVENEEAYASVVPYYIAEIYYFQGRKETSLKYADSILLSGSAQYYEKDLKLLIGQLYFEKGDYALALPLLEFYKNHSDKLSKEVLYEISYCNFKNDLIPAAIEGFKQLSNEKDSLGQNSMYLLGSLYLKINDKISARNAFQFSAFNNSNQTQQQICRFNYAKLSYELGFQDVALNEMKLYLKDYPGSANETEAKEILTAILANTNNFNEGLLLYNSFAEPTTTLKKILPRLLYGRAIELINDQQLAAADELLSKIYESNFSEKVLPYANFWSGEIAYRQQRFDQAVANYTNFIQSKVPAQGEANSVNAKYNLGYCWFQLQNYTNALEQFESVIQSISATSNSLQQDAFIRTADCYFMLKEYSKAGLRYEQIIALSFQQADYALFQQAMIAGIKNNNAKINLLSSLSKSYPHTNLLTEAAMEIAIAYMAEENFTDAIPYLKKITLLEEANGLKPKAFLKLGLAYYNKDDNQQALTSYKQLIQKYPQSAETEEALTIIKEIYVEEGKPDDYFDLMQANGITISVTDADSISFSAAKIKYNSNDYAAAITALNSYLKRFNEGAFLLDANYLLGVCYMQSKDWTNVIKYFEFVNSRGVSAYYDLATLELARIYYFEMQDYTAAKKYFEMLRSNAVNQETQSEALRGLVRCYFQLKEFSIANEAAQTLLANKNAGTEDKAIAFIVLGKSLQVNNNCEAAIASFKSVISLSKSALGAEARYELAACYFVLNNLPASAKAAMSAIKETGSYDEWVTKSYILQGDIFMKQKDYFNAKATYESIAKYAAEGLLKEEAKQKYQNAVDEEMKSSKKQN